MITCNEKITGYELADKLNLRDPSQAVALFINGEPRDFFTEIQPGDRVEILGFDDKRGKEVFWHTSAHILAQAIMRLWPDAKLTIGPAIDAGFYYDIAHVHISEEDFPRIEEEMQKIVKENHKPQKYTFKDREEATQRFKDNPYKVELIRDFPEGPFTGYSQGEFFDLCRGPHLPMLGKVKAVKLLKTSAAYWRGDPKRETLTRIYGISFPDRKLLKEYLDLLEEVKKRDHKVIGKKLELFTFFDVAPGMPFILPHGMVLWNRLLEFWRTLHREADYAEIKTPAMLNRILWEKSGHWENYRENMYALQVDDIDYALKPMNCPACMLYFGSKKHSYRDLPLRIGEIGHVHRHELSGSLSGLLRVRAFHQDDAHMFMMPEHIQSEILGVIKLCDRVYKTFGLNYHMELSTRPAKSIGSDEIWEEATNGLKNALDEWGAGYRINEGDGAFYGPKIDIHVKDALGRSWQCGTIQLDMALPERFELEYTSSDKGIAKRPIMVHRVIYGSLERFIAILIEHFAGKFPLWISPQPIRIIPVADRHLDFARDVMRKIHAAGLLCTIDASHESVSKKVREAQMAQVNYMLTIGDKECENNNITVRTRNSVVVGEMQVDKFLEEVCREFKDKALTSPFEST